MPEEKRSARSLASPAACCARCSAAHAASVNMSATVVVPKTAARRSASPWEWPCPSMKPGSSVRPAPSIVSTPAGTGASGPTTAITPSSTSTVARSITSSPSKTRTPTTASDWAPASVGRPASASALGTANANASPKTCGRAALEDRGLVFIGRSFEELFETGCRRPGRRSRLGRDAFFARCCNHSIMMLERGRTTCGGKRLRNQRARLPRGVDGSPRRSPP